jgi:hypothetical protein
MKPPRGLTLNVRLITQLLLALEEFIDLAAPRGVDVASGGVLETLLEIV